MDEFTDEFIISDITVAIHNQSQETVIEIAPLAEDNEQDNEQVKALTQWSLDKEHAIYSLLLAVNEYPF